MEEISGTSTDQGTLMYWHYGDDAPQKISSDVVNYSVTSNLKSGEILPNGYLYMKYTSVDADKEVHGNWMHCDGKKSTKLVTDVIN